MSEIAIRRGSTVDSKKLAIFGATSFRAAFAAANHPDDIDSYVRQAFSQTQIESELQDPASTFLLVEREMELLGYAKLRGSGAKQCVSGARPVELQRIYTDPQLIGTGMGRTLLQASIDKAREDTHTTLWLGVWEHNSHAIAFYRYMGFETVGNHDFMLGNDQQTDLIMQLELL